MPTANPRYSGKPLLRLLECYVLWAIDQLTDKELSILQGMAPKLRSLYGVEGEWQQVIAFAANLPVDMPTRIRDVWTKNTEIARTNGATLTPQQFAEMFVDANLAG
jgi:hypothetical protein